MTADQITALKQLAAGTELRHSVDPAVSDFVGISDPVGLLGSLRHWQIPGAR
jgi:hypothetical protein